jgi:hypothetical protein
MCSAQEGSSVLIVFGVIFVLLLRGLYEKDSVTLVQTSCPAEQYIKIQLHPHRKHTVSPLQNQPVNAV